MTTTTKPRKRPAPKADAPQSFTLAKGDLWQALNVISDYAADGPMIPSLRAVHLLADGPHVYFAATDRFIAGAYRVRSLLPNTITTEVQASISLPDARRALALFKPVRGEGEVEVKIDFTPTAVTISELGGLIEGQPIASLTFNRLGQEDQVSVHSIRKLLGSRPRQIDGASNFAMDPSVFGRVIGTAKKLRQPLWFDQPEGRGRVRVSCGEDFIGMAMYARREDRGERTDVYTGWDDWLGAGSDETKSEAAA